MHLSAFFILFKGSGKSHSSRSEPPVSLCVWLSCWYNPLTFLSHSLLLQITVTVNHHSCFLFLELCCMALFWRVFYNYNTDPHFFLMLWSFITNLFFEHLCLCVFKMWANGESVYWISVFQLFSSWITMIWCSAVHTACSSASLMNQR